MTKTKTENRVIYYGKTKEVLNELGIEGLPQYDEKYCIAFNNIDESLEWGYETAKTLKEINELARAYK